MQFRQGMLGVAVVAIALAGALIGSWVMSMDVEERTITVYDPLTDITPLFDSELAPTYTEYNPTSNYTGYYTDATTQGNKHFFGGLDYTEATRPNNYKVNLPPETSTQVTIDLSVIDGSGGDEWRLSYYPEVDYPDSEGAMEHLTIPDLLTALNLGDFTKVILANPNAADYEDGGFITFVTNDMLEYRHNLLDEWYNLTMKNPALTGPLPLPTIPDITYVDASEVPNPIMAASYDAETGVVELFADRQATISLGIYTPNQVSVCWQDSGFLGFDIYTDAQKFPPNSYMDPTKGVRFE